MIQAAHTTADPVRQHLDALHTSSQLTLTFRRMYQREAAMVTPEDVIAVLHRAGVNFVLMGTHGLGGWRSEPRATQDVDVLVTKKESRKAVRVLRMAYPNLEVNDTPAVTRFIDPASDKPAIDVLKPTQAVYEVVFRHTIPVGDMYRIPNLEMALASKFAAMASPDRELSKRLIDAGDLVDVIRTNRDQIDQRKLEALGNKVYPGGGRRILLMIADIDTGRPIQL